MFLKCEKDQYLTSGEQIAIDYINNHVDTITNLTITDIAELAYVSASTVSRAIRKCGITSMTDVRYKIVAGEWAKKNFIVNEIVEQACEDFVKTVERIDTSSILKIVDYIRKARIIHVFAGGATRIVAHEFEFQMQNQGYNAYVQSEGGIIKSLNGLVSPDDLVVIFSAKGGTVDLIEGAREAKKAGAAVVLCCGVERTPMEEFADVIVYGHSRRAEYKRNFATNSRFGLQVIVQIIAEYLTIVE